MTRDGKLLILIAVAFAGALSSGPSRADANAYSSRMTVAQAPSPQTDVPVRIEVATVCEEGEPVFTIVSRGDTWPAVGKVAVYRTNDRTLVIQRNMRMKAGQQASFRAKGAGAGVEVGLWVEPTWYQRPFAYDAKATCQ